MDNDQYYQKIHSGLMYVAFGILVPLGVLTAFMRKKKWFQIHAVFMSLAILCVIASFFVILYKSFKTDTGSDSTHLKLGFALVVAIFFQGVYGLVMHLRRAGGQTPRPT